MSVALKMPLTRFSASALIGSQAGIWDGVDGSEPTHWHLAREPSGSWAQMRQGCKPWALTGLLLMFRLKSVLDSWSCHRKKKCYRLASRAFKGKNWLLDSACSEVLPVKHAQAVPICCHWFSVSPWTHHTPGPGPAGAACVVSSC